LTAARAAFDRTGIGAPSASGRRAVPRALGPLQQAECRALRIVARTNPRAVWQCDRLERDSAGGTRGGQWQNRLSGNAPDSASCSCRVVGAGSMNERNSPLIGLLIATSAALFRRRRSRFAADPQLPIR